MQSRLEFVVSYLQDVPTPLRDDVTIYGDRGQKVRIINDRFNVAAR